MADLPVLYSFRRCPYAMRARLALRASGQKVELREIVLRDKAPEFVETSPKATVPVLAGIDGKVLEESLDIMNWALTKNDAEGWLVYPEREIAKMHALIEEADGPFKHALDRYKYENRYDGVIAREQRDLAVPFLKKLNAMLEGQMFLFGERFSFADAAILPFVRQFAHVDRDWFWNKDWPNLLRWLEAFLASDHFAAIMEKYPKWKAGDAVTIFPQT